MPPHVLSSHVLVTSLADNLDPAMPSIEPITSSCQFCTCPSRMVLLSTHATSAPGLSWILLLTPPIHGSQSPLLIMTPQHGRRSPAHPMPRLSCPSSPPLPYSSFPTSAPCQGSVRAHAFWGEKEGPLRGDCQEWGLLEISVQLFPH